MTDYVRETLCTNCIHREICAIKTTYLDTLNKLPGIDTDFSLTLSCKHYSKEVPALKTNMPNYNPIVDVSDRTTFTYSTTSLQG